jgi:hypothetical protein
MLTAMPDALHRLRRPSADLPFGDALLYRIARVAQRLSARRIRIVKYHLTAQPVAPTPLLSASRAGTLRVERIDANHPLYAILLAQSPRPPAVIRARLAHGAVCFAALKADTLLGFLWLKHEAYEEDEVHCLFLPRPAAQAAWDFDVWVHPAHRASRVFLRLWDTAFAYLRARGVRWTMSRVNAYNPDSLNAHGRLGAVTLGTATFCCIGERQWLRVERSGSLQRQPDRDGRPVLCVFPPQGSAS